MGELAAQYQAERLSDAQAHRRPRRDRVRLAGDSQVRQSLAALIAAGRYRVLTLTKSAATAQASAASPAPPSR